MTRISALLLAVMLSCGAVQAWAGDGDVRTCDLTKVIQCLPDEACQEASAKDVGLPRFVQIDLRSRKLVSLDKEVTRTSEIASVDRKGGLIMMHGNELRSWTMTVAEDSGDLTLSAAGDGEGFIVFGSCITK